MKEKSSNVVLLGIVSFINDVSSEMIMPILPMFITALGGGGVVVGLVGGIRESVSSILKVLFGYLSDRAGKRKIFVVFGYLISSVFKLFLAFSRIWQNVLLFSGLERIGKGLRTAPRDALIAESMPDERGKGFGIHRALDTSGAILGSAIVFLLFWFLHLDFKAIILVAAVISVFSLAPLHFVREKREQKRDITFKLSLKSLDLPLRMFILVSGVFSLANFNYMFFILRAKEQFSGRLSVGVPIILYILFNIFYAAFAVPFGRLSDRIGRRKVIIFGYFLFSLTTLGFALFDSLLAFVLLFALYGIVYAIIDGNQRAYVSDLSPKDVRATALGFYHTVVGIAALPASLIAGILWQSVSPAMTFVYGCVLSAASAILFISLGGYFRGSSFSSMERE
ncbi:MFS transporter [bacterium]|nr:MAG: MFS transporter [bacterium]